MPDFSVHYSHVLLFTAANFLLSWFWYSPAAFGAPWLKALGKEPRDPGRERGPEERKRLPLLLLGGLLSSFLRMLILAAAVAGLNARSVPSGALVGLLAWLGFTLTASLDTVWEGRPGRVLAINNGLYFVVFVAFGALLAAWS